MEERNKRRKPTFPDWDRHDVIDVGFKGRTVYAGIPARAKYYKKAIRHCPHYEENCKHGRCCREGVDTDKARLSCKKDGTCRYSADYAAKFKRKLRDALFEICRAYGVDDERMQKYYDLVSSPWGIDSWWRVLGADMDQVRKASRGPRNRGTSVGRAVNEAVAVCRCACDSRFACQYGQRGFMYSSVENYNSGWEHSNGGIGFPRCDECAVGRVLTILGAYKPDDILEAYHDKQERVLTYKGCKWLHDRSRDCMKDMLGKPMIDRGKVKGKDTTILDAACAYLRLCCLNKGRGVQGLGCDGRNCATCSIARLLVLLGDCTRDEATRLREWRDSMQDKSWKDLGDKVSAVGVTDLGRVHDWPL